MYPQDVLTVAYCTTPVVVKTGNQSVPFIDVSNSSLAAVQADGEKKPIIDIPLPKYSGSDTDCPPCIVRGNIILDLSDVLEIESVYIDIYRSLSL